MLVHVFVVVIILSGIGGGKNQGLELNLPCSLRVVCCGCLTFGFVLFAFIKCQSPPPLYC